jgi:hypothetical protein
VSKYLLLQATTNAGMGLVVGVGLTLIGVPYAPLWGLLTALLRFVPYVGVWAAALFPVGLAVAKFEGWVPAVEVLALYAAGDLLLANVVEPLLFGHGTGVSSAALLVAAAFWAFLWGPVGLLLAVPLTVCLVVLGEHVPSLRFLRTMLGDAPQVDPAARFFHRVLTGEPDEAAVLAAEQANGRPLLDVYDETVLPAIAQAKAERDRGDLSAAEERRFYRAAADLLRGPLAVHRAAAAADGADAAAAGPAGGADRVVVGCSTRGVADRLALTMLRDVGGPAGVEVEVVPAGKLVEAVRRHRAGGAEVVACVAAVSPGGLAEAAGLCRAAKAVGKGVTAIVGRWGVTTDRPAVEKYLTAAGADRVAWTLRETLAAVAPEQTATTNDSAVQSPAGADKVTVPA